METVFKVGDKVFCIVNGWGEVIKIEEEGTFPISVTSIAISGAIESCSYTLDGKYFIESPTPTLSFTEYTLQGFTQERPIVLPEVGELCLVRDDDEDLWVLKCFRGYYPSLEKPFVTSPRNVYYKQIKRIKILD